MENSLKLYRTAPETVRAGIDPEILFTAAACHDIGRINGKEKHHVDSGKMIRADMTLRKWFDEAGIELIAQAAEDHRASSGAVSRSIYGKIVAEADRLSGLRRLLADPDNARAAVTDAYFRLTLRPCSDSL